MVVGKMSGDKLEKVLNEHASSSDTEPDTRCYLTGVRALPSSSPRRSRIRIRRG